jgi:hypothetical protein
MDARLKTLFCKRKEKIVAKSKEESIPRNKQGLLYQ